MVSPTQLCWVVSQIIWVRDITPRHRENRQTEKVKSWSTWWRHQMETFSALLAICAGNSPVPGEFPAQRPVTRSFDVFFDLHLNKRLSKQTWGWWFETLPRALWRHSNEFCLLRPGWPPVPNDIARSYNAFYFKLIRYLMVDCHKAVETGSRNRRPRSIDAKVFPRFPSWWRQDMKAFSALLAHCESNPLNGSP